MPLYIITTDATGDGLGLIRNFHIEIHVYNIYSRYRQYVWYPRKLQLFAISRFCVIQGLEIVGLIFFCTRMHY